MEKDELLTELTNDKVIYEYSNAQTMYDFSKRKRDGIAKSLSAVVLTVFVSLLLVWVFFSLIWRLIHEGNTSKVWLSMLPSFILALAEFTIIIISVRGAWGDLIRSGFKYNLIGGSNAFERRHIEELRKQVKLADANRPEENAFCITLYNVYITLNGQCKNYLKDRVRAFALRKDKFCAIQFQIDGEEDAILFPELIPADDYYLLRKGLGKNLKTVKNPEKIIQRNSKGQRLYGGETLGSIITSAFMSCVLLAGGILMMLVHYLWEPKVPPFIGLFFVLMSGFAFHSSFRCILPSMDSWLLPLIAGSVFCTIPPMALIWITESLKNTQFSFLYLLTHADALAVGMTFFTGIGIYALCVAISNLYNAIKYRSDR